MDSCKNLIWSFILGQGGNFRTVFSEDKIEHGFWEDTRVGRAYMTLIINGNHNEVQKYIIYTISPFPKKIQLLI